jgi:hypothetical protein
MNTGFRSEKTANIRPSYIGGYQCFGGMYYLCHQGSCEDEGDMFVRNVDFLPPQKTTVRILVCIPDVSKLL